MINSITAKEASSMIKLPSLNENIMNNIFKQIKETCESGNNHIYRSDISDGEKKYLVKLGYNITHLNKNLYEISW